MTALGPRIASALLRKTGRRYALDPRLPITMVLGVVVTAGFELLHGMLRVRRLIFIGRGTRVRGRSQISFGRYCSIGRYCTIDGYSGALGVVLGANSRIGDFSRITVTSHMSLVGAGLRLGAGSGLGDYTHLGCAGGVVIGSNVICGSYVSFHSQNHNFEDDSRLIREQGTSELPITIGDNCWIGAKATFLAGASIGSGCVVAAGAVVRDQFGDDCVIAGVPARLVKSRVEPRD